jgi:hypothetical protein
LSNFHGWHAAQRLSVAQAGCGGSGSRKQAFALARVDVAGDFTSKHSPVGAPHEGRSSVVTSESTLQAVTANSVSDGAPIYLTAAQQWSLKIADAALAADVSELLRWAQADALNAIGAYAIEVVRAEGVVRPVGLREEIRAFGPTA